MTGDPFGTNVFSQKVMQRYLPQDSIRRVLEPGQPLSMEIADAVADAMKQWAMARGATHYCHWFQPLTGNTAEKHDSFLSGLRDGEAIYRLTGKQLLMGESDASSFPTGGLRGTAYARGCTAWDRASPAFLKEEPAGTILCIPTLFLSHTGQALDTKTPLLRSMQALDTQARRLLALFGQDLGQIIPFVGVEQEYFLVDRAKYLQRRDLIYCGRTLFGAPAPKGQELDDQYFGTIRARQGAFMAELNRRLWRLGVPAVTQHNEVAPAQHELACVYTRANMAVDQNQLVMETMKQLASRHGLVCLLHEKPFAGVNGSGKHNNWSIGSENGENLLDPGPDPRGNLRFQLILACILQAVDRHADLLRLSAGCPGNDLRLGGQEAPPAIISVYLGDRLEALVEAILAGEPMKPLNFDDSDRNRTSPFAFTGNKFEFRMVGASDSVAQANTILNSIVAQSFREAADALENARDFPACCDEYIRDLLTRHRRIRFRGDGYSRQWQEEAARRGLPILPGMVDAVEALTAEKSVALFESLGVYSRAELESRAEILYETYAKRLRIEANTMLHMASKHFIPVAIRFLRELAETRDLLDAPPTLTDLLEKTGAILENISQSRQALAEILAKADQITDQRAVANVFYRQAVPRMLRLREAVDGLEMLVSKDLWPMPTYGDLLFEV